MFFWLLIGCSTISLAVQSAAPRTIWYEQSRPATALLGIWYTRLFMTRCSGATHILQIINLDDGIIEQELTLTARPVQWASDSNNERLIILLHNNHVILVNISRANIELFHIPSMPVLAVNFLHDEPIMYVNHECDHCAFMWMKGNHIYRPKDRKYCGRQRLSRHLLTADCCYALDMNEEGCKVTSCRNGTEFFLSCCPI